MDSSRRDELERRRSALSPERRQRLAERLRGQNHAAGAGPDVIPRRPDRHTAPLSFAQERLWFLDRLVPENPAFNEHALLVLDGRLDVAALGHGLERLVARHEAFRLEIIDSDGVPSQRVHEASERVSAAERRLGGALRAAAPERTR